MKRRIFGFQRRVWWPKCTPASSSSAIPTSATGCSLYVCVAFPCGWSGPEELNCMSLCGQGRDPSPHGSKFRLTPENSRTSGRRASRSLKLGQYLLQVRGQRREHLDALLAQRMVEGQAGGVQELA